MWVYKLALFPAAGIIPNLIASLAEDSRFIVAQLGHNLIVFVQDGNSGMEFRNQQQMFVRIKIRWQWLCEMDKLTWSSPKWW